jgi:hypothetical protein
VASVSPGLSFGQPRALLAKIWIDKRLAEDCAWRSAVAEGATLAIDVSCVGHNKFSTNMNDLFLLDF